MDRQQIEYWEKSCKYSSEAEQNPPWPAMTWAIVELFQAFRDLFISILFLKHNLLKFPGLTKIQTLACEFLGWSKFYRSSETRSLVPTIHNLNHFVRQLGLAAYFGHSWSRHQEHFLLPAIVRIVVTDLFQSSRKVSYSSSVLVSFAPVESLH